MTLKKKYSLTDLAKELGVSTTTVSFVLNDRAKEMKISEETQKRVFDLAKQWNYRPNALARSLRMGKTRLIGLIIPNIADLFYAKIAHQLERHAAENDYRLIFGSTDENLKLESDLLDTMRNQSVDGIIMAPTDPEAEHVTQLIEEGFPLVLIDRALDSQATNSIVVENEKGFQQLTQHLITKGCKRIALLTFPTSVLTLAQRLDGYKNALAQNNIPLDSELIVEISSTSVKQGVKESLDRLCSGGDPIDGIVCTNNILGSSAIWYLNVFKQETLGQYEIGCFDNIDLFDYSSPAVTATAQPLKEIANQSLDLLQAKIKDKNSPNEHRVLPLDFIER